MSIKRTLCIILVFSIAMSSFTLSVFGAENEKGVDTAYERAVTVLSALGIMQGKTDDGFNAEDSVTRAEMSAVTVRFLGMDSNGIGGSDAGYRDVAEEYWAKPYIDAASALGLASGNGDGTFAPEEYVTAGQAAKILVCALGYEPKAQDRGGYPTGYMTVAKELGIFDGVSLPENGDAPLERQKLAKMVYNALEVDLMEIKAYGAGSYAAVSDGVCALGEYHDTEKKSGTVTANYASAAADMNLAEDEVCISGEKYKTEVDVDLYLGYYADFYVKKEKNSDEGKIIAFFPQTDKISRTEVDFDDVTAVNVDESFNIEIKYYEKNGNREKNASVTAPTVYYNGRTEEVSGAAELQRFIDEHMKQGQFVLLKNSSGGRRDVLFMENYSAYVVADTNAERDLIAYDIYTAAGTQRGELDLSSDKGADKRVFWYDGDTGKRLGSMGDIMIGDVISVYESSDGLLYRIYRSKARVTGKVERVQSLSGSTDAPPAGTVMPTEYQTISETDMDGFTVTKGNKAPTYAIWGFEAEKAAENGRKVKIGTDGGGGKWIIGKNSRIVDADTSGDMTVDMPEIIKNNKLFYLSRHWSDDGKGTSGTPVPSTSIQPLGLFNNHRVKKGDKIRITAWVFPSEIVEVGGNLSTEGIDQYQDVNYRMWLIEPWKSVEQPGYQSGKPGAESSVGTIPANKWSEISFEYEVNDRIKNITNIRIDNEAKSGVYPLRLYLAGVKVERAAAAEKDGEDYILPQDDGRYKLFIGGKGYEPVRSLYSSMIPTDGEVTLLLDYRGRIAGYLKGESKSSYGLLLNAGIKDNALDEDTLQLRILDSDGKVRTYETMKKVRAYNGSEVTKIAAASLITDQPSDPMTDWHLWSTNNAANFQLLQRNWITDSIKSRAASRKIIYYETNPEGLVKTVIVPSVPEDNPDCKLHMISNFNLDTWRNRGNMRMSVGSRQLAYTTVLDPWNKERTETSFSIANRALVYEAFPMSYDEEDYSVVHGGVSSLGEQNEYGMMYWADAQLYRYAGSDTVDFMIIAPKYPNRFKTVVVDCVGTNKDGYTLEGYIGGEPYSAKIKPNTRLMEYVPVVKYVDDDAVPLTEADAQLITRDMLPQLAEEQKTVWTMTRDSEFMGGGTPTVDSEGLERGDVVRVVERDGEIVYLEVVRRAATGIGAVYASTSRGAGRYWSLFTMDTSVRGTVVSVDNNLNVAEVKGYYPFIAEQYHSQKNKQLHGSALTEFTTWLHIPSGTKASVYDCKTEKCYPGTELDIEVGDEIYSYSYSSSPSGIVIFKNYGN